MRERERGGIREYFLFSDLNKRDRGSYVTLTPCNTQKVSLAAFPRSHGAQLRKHASAPRCTALCAPEK